MFIYLDETLESYTLENTLSRQIVPLQIKHQIVMIISVSYFVIINI